jgi:hypothetical protein
VHNILRVEIIDIILQKYFQQKSTTKIRIKDLAVILRESNPLIFTKVDNLKIKKELIAIYPIHNNMKKKTKWYKITKKQTMNYLFEHNVHMKGVLYHD